MSEIQSLCDCSDFVFLQEHWLLPNELHILNNFHTDFLGIGYSAVELTNDILVDRPYGGTGILYRKCLAHCVRVVDTYDPRISAICFSSKAGLILMVCVYMPTDYGTYDSYEQYADICAKIVALFEDSEAVSIVLCGDFNCRPGSQFIGSYTDLINNLNLVESDVNRLTNSFTYCNDSGTVSSWLDHFLCSIAIDQLIGRVDILYNYISSDHKPLLLLLRDAGATDPPILMSNVDEDVTAYVKHITDWKRCDDMSLRGYSYAFDSELSKIDITKELLDIMCSCDCSVQPLIDDYYSSIMGAIRSACTSTLPSKHVTSNYEQFIVPGWNDIVDDKHAIARDAFMEWMAVGKPRQGPEYLLMQKTRAAFKLSLRYCRQHQKEIQADCLARNLLDKQFDKFWSGIRKCNIIKASVKVNTINGCTGDVEISEMWKRHFGALYNSISDKGEKDTFISVYQR